MNGKNILIAGLLLFSTNIYAQSEEELPKNAEELKVLKEQVKQGDLHAQYLLGYCYLTGISGVTVQKTEEGKRLIKKAAEAGNADACRIMYKMNPLKNYDYRGVAEKLYTEDGGGEACYYMAELYANDKRQCQRWLKTSLKKGYARARTALESIYNND